VQTFQEQDTVRLSVCSLYYLMGCATLNFPGTSTSGPSLWVVVGVNRKEGLPDRHLFPMKVPWDVWHEVVVPVVQGEEVQKLVQSFVGGRMDWRTAVQQISLLLWEQRTGPATYESVPVVGAGEPVSRGPVTELEIDSNIVWPEGHLKLTYPEVL